MRSKRPQVLGPWLVGWWWARHGVLGKDEGGWEGEEEGTRSAWLTSYSTQLKPPRRAKLVGLKNGAECIDDR